MQGFKKVDPDRWEFANEGFLGGQKHLLKTIKRRRNVIPSASQQVGGPCVELGHYGVEEELERLKRDKNLLMAEIVKLKLEHQASKDQVAAMEERIRITEKRQQQTMSFVAKIFANPILMQQYVEKHRQKKETEQIDIGHKRRLTMSPSVEDLVDVVSVAVGSDQLLNDHAEGLDLEHMQRDIETALFSAALEDEASSIVDLTASSIQSCSSANLDPVAETIWKELLSGKEAAEVLVDDQSDADVNVVDLVAETPECDEDLFDLVDQMGYLSSKTNNSIG